jgi:hypothetical protein
MDVVLIILAAAGGLVLLLAVVWLVVMASVTLTSRHSPVGRFLEPTEGELSAQDYVKSISNHPGAGGNG